jgi:hypothetical protein
MNDDTARQWRKSSYSSNSANCVEVCTHEATVAVRDSKDREGPELEFTGPAWSAFVEAIKHGQF